MEVISSVHLVPLYQTKLQEPSVLHLQSPMELSTAVSQHNGHTHHHLHFKQPAKTHCHWDCHRSYINMLRRRKNIFFRFSASGALGSPMTRIQGFVDLANPNSTITNTNTTSHAITFQQSLTQGKLRVFHQNENLFKKCIRGMLHKQCLCVPPYSCAAHCGCAQSAHVLRKLQPPRRETMDNHNRHA